MKMNKMKEVLKSKKWAGRITAVAMAAILGSAALLSYKSQVPELPSYVDPILEVSIEEEETPLASAPKVTTKTSKKTTTKKVTMKKASAKSYTKSLPTTKKTTTKTSNTSQATVKTQTTLVTATKEKYTKKSKIKVVTTTVTTTVKTTTTEKVQQPSINTNVSVTTNVSTKKYVGDIRQLAPAMDTRVLNAYDTLGFKVTVDPSVNYAGYFDAKTAQITLKAADDTVYHELGHFVAFLAGNADTQSSFVNIYNKEKALYQGANKNYSTQNSSEYFAESMKDYVLNNAALKASRPQTYEAIAQALNKITDTQVATAKKIYGAIWARA